MAAQVDTALCDREPTLSRDGAHALVTLTARLEDAAAAYLRAVQTTADADGFPLLAMLLAGTRADLADLADAAGPFAADVDARAADRGARGAARDLSFDAFLRAERTILFLYDEAIAACDRAPDLRRVLMQHHAARRVQFQALAHRAAALRRCA
jgi:hypothetical protein